MTHPITSYLNSVKEKLNSGLTTEHSHRPALADLFEALDPDVSAINEPIRIECGAPDLAFLKNDFLVGYVEAKDIGISLDEIESSDQLKRYRQALENLILTDYLEFRWYVDGELRRKIRLAVQDSRGEFQLESQGRQNLEELLRDFLAHQPQPIGTPRKLAERMARLTHLIRDVIVTAFDKGQASDILAGWRQAFAEVLIPDLDQPENLGQFADMFAQTLSYGLFSARIMHQTGPFNRHTAQKYIPRTNPFLRDFFSYITGARLSDEPYAGYVNDLIQVLALSDMHAILSDFGRQSRQDDPMMHFYETFLAAYDPQLREQRGVYYTPMPVVSFIVRSVDHLLKTRFNLPRGLADTTLLPDGTHKVLVLDPAVGTATFLYAVIDLIREEFMSRGDAGMWSGYVRDHLLDRIFGFELMMAPYAVAHFKLALQLAGYDLDLPEEGQKRWSYDFQADDRIRVYLTNTLEVLPEEMVGLYGPMQFVAEEAKAADKVKQDMPIMVILGNPPYSISSTNKGEYIENLMQLYKEAVRNERNIQPLSDDYLKFIRFAHERIEQTGYGIIGFITNHKYLHGLIHRGVREELLKTFDEIYILNLHGNSNIGESPPNDILDENVFDIKQGVSITILVKCRKECPKTNVFYSDIWGSRDIKYEILNSTNLDFIKWEVLNPIAPNYFFVPKDFSLFDEYSTYIAVNDLFNLYSSGVKTHRDSFVIDNDPRELLKRMQIFRDRTISDEEISRTFGIKNTRDWNLIDARLALRNDNCWDDHIKSYIYRPFDFRYIYYSPDIIELPRQNVMKHLIKKNVALIVDRTTSPNTNFSHALVSNQIVDVRSIPDYGGAPFIFPLFLYPKDDEYLLFDNITTSPWNPDIKSFNRVPNLNYSLINKIENRLGLRFDSCYIRQKHDIKNTFGPKEILAYLYAILYSSTYRERYSEFLEIDFPRIPFTSDVELFCNLANLGQELIDIHLMDSSKLENWFTNFPIPGDSQVKKRGGYPKYNPPVESQGGRVYINRDQYFEGVPQNVWEFEIGGYQVLHKWLKDRRGRTLDYDDKRHYQQIVVALSETIRLMDEIDVVIPSWPIE